MGNDNDFLNDWASGAADDGAGDLDTSGDGGGEALDLIEHDDGTQVDNGDGSDTATGDASETTADDDQDDGREVPYAAMKAERAKRQEAAARAEKAEARQRELEAQITALQNPTPARAQPAEGTANETADLPDYWSNPQAYTEALMQRQLQTAFQEYNKQMQYRDIENRMRQQHADYDEVSQLAGAAAKQDKELAVRILTSPDPGAELYKVGTQIKELRDMQANPDAYRAKLRAEIEAEMGASDPSTQDTQPAAPRRRTVDLSTRRNAKGESTSAPPDPFKALFPE